MLSNPPVDLFDNQLCFSELSASVNSLQLQNLATLAAAAAAAQSSTSPTSNSTLSTSSGALGGLASPGETMNLIYVQLMLQSCQFIQRMMTSVVLSYISSFFFM